jgi:hypothetical protein
VKSIYQRIEGQMNRKHTFASCTLIVVLGVSITTWGQSGRGRGATPPLKSPEVTEDGRIIFRIRMPNAKQVIVNVEGFFAPLEMRNDGNGVWTATTTDPLPPDIYTYRFVVDGTAVADPSNPRTGRIISRQFVSLEEASLLILSISTAAV